MSGMATRGNYFIFEWIHFDIQAFYDILLPRLLQIYYDRYCPIVLTHMHYIYTERVAILDNIMATDPKHIPYGGKPSALLVYIATNNDIDIQKLDRLLFYDQTRPLRHVYGGLEFPKAGGLLDEPSWPRGAYSPQAMHAYISKQPWLQDMVNNAMVGAFIGFLSVCNLFPGFDGGQLLPPGTRNALELLDGKYCQYIAKKVYDFNRTNRGAGVALPPLRSFYNSGDNLDPLQK